MEIKLKNWGETNKGEKVTLYTITNKQGNTVQVTDYGATLVSVCVPDKNNKKESVVLGFPNLQGYLEDTCYMGASVGRYANRIENAKFSIEGREYKIDVNPSNKHALHGGVEGLNFRVWSAKTTEDSVKFSIISPDGDQGFPGKLELNVTYKWSEDNTLSIEFEATTNKTTPVSFTNHAYFNLNGKGNILNQQLKIHSNEYLLMRDGGVVYGERKKVESTPFNFKEFKAIGKDIESEDEQMQACKGYDQSFVIKDEDNQQEKQVAEAYDPESGRALSMKTTFPTLHLYSANYLSSTQTGHCGKKYNEREAFCLEAQFAPNSPNLPNFPSCYLKPGSKFNHRISINFSVKQ